MAGLKEYAAKAVAVDASTLDAMPLKFARVGSLAVMQVRFDNFGQADRRLHEVHVLDTYGSEDHTMGIRFHRDSRTIAHARLAPGAHIIATITMENVERLGNQFQLEVFEPDGPDANDPETWLIGLDPPSENEGKLSVHVQGVYGAIWLGQKVVTMDGVEDRLEPTSLKGLGVRIAYGLTKRLSFEAEMMGATSGEADFRAVTVRDGEIARTGDVYRSAVLGRVQGGLMMRFGEETFRPLVRLGLGLQGASQSAEIVGADGVRRDGPEVPFDFILAAIVGAGLDMKLGNHLVAGFAICTVARVSTLSGTGSGGALGAEFHLGYTW